MNKVVSVPLDLFVWSMIEEDRRRVFLFLAFYLSSSSVIFHLLWIGDGDVVGSSYGKSMVMV